MKSKVLACAVVTLMVAGGAMAQGRLVGPPKTDTSGIGATSEFDLFGRTNGPEAMAGLEACVQPSACTFSFCEEDVWAMNLRSGASNCFSSINNTFRTIVDRTFTPEAGTEYLSITLTGQASVSNAVVGTDRHGLTLECTVFQGSNQIACPGTTALPFLVAQTFLSSPSGARTGATSYVSYHGTVKLDNDDEEVRVLIRVRSSDPSNTVIGGFCYGYVELTQHVCLFY